jgi:hypothetical protein
MRIAHVAKDGALELNWMWLPTFIGQNYMVLKELERFWKDLYPEGVSNTPEELDKLHDITIDWFGQKFKIIGLSEYLSAIRHVQGE